MKTWKSLFLVLIVSLILFVSFYWVMVPNTTLNTDNIFKILLFRIVSGGGAFFICFIVLLIILYAINLFSNEKKSKLDIASTSLKVSIAINIVLAIGYIYANFRK